MVQQLLHNKTIKLGVLTLTIYTFDEIDTELPMHNHTTEDIHITFISKGSFMAYGNWPPKQLNTGDLVDWQPNDPHRFVAREANSKMINILKA